MKKLTAFFAVMLCTVCLIGCAKARYKLEIIDAYNYPIENTLKSSYAEGEEVTIKLETITEHYYALYVNGVKQYAASHDMYYTYYTFTMPAEDVVVKIEDHWVGIPTPYDVISEYVAEENDKQYLVLPISKSKIHIRDEYKPYLNDIDIDLLKKAEETITNKMSLYTDSPGFNLQTDNEGNLCLGTEWIVDIDPPNTVSGENGEIIVSGCNIDHKHIFFSERITKNISFSGFLDGENFVAGLGQGDFLAQMGKYRYEGIKLSDSMGLFHYDGEYGGGCGVNDKYFGFANDYMATEDGKSATYSNRFYTNIPLEGLTLPHGITFDDTLKTVLRKLGIIIDLKEDSVSDKENTGKITLRSDGTSSLELTNCLLSSDTIGKPLYDFELKYTENYQTTRKDGRISDVTRYIIMSFTDDNNKLGKFDVAVVEKYEID